MANKSHSTNQTISLPQGGGAVKGIGETFQPNLFSGTGNFSVPLFTCSGRNGFGPQLTLQYSTGNGNGPFGLGWQLSVYHYQDRYKLKSCGVSADNRS